MENNMETVGDLAEKVENCDPQILNELRKLADQGNIDALLNWGGVDQDYSKLKECYEEIIKHGNMEVLYCLGTFYENGLGVSQDYSKARCLYTCVYEIGVKLNDLYGTKLQAFVNASYSLGIFLENGFVLEQDHYLAKKRFEKVIEIGGEDALKQLVNSHKSNDALLVLAEFNEKKGNTTLAIDYYRRYVESNRGNTSEEYANILVHLASLLLDNDTVADMEGDINEAIDLLIQAVKLGNKDALSPLVQLLHQNERDDEALDYLRRPGNENILFSLIQNLHENEMDEYAVSFLGLVNRFGDANTINFTQRIQQEQEQLEREINFLRQFEAQRQNNENTINHNDDNQNNNNENENNENNRNGNVNNNRENDIDNRVLPRDNHPNYFIVIDEVENINGTTVKSKTTAM